jgi:hypothetical protein
VGVPETMMSSSASVAQHIAVVILGILLATVSAVIIAWLWPGMGLPVFVIFLVGWGIERINTAALERRHPELILTPGWKYTKVRYKPMELSEGEYEITLSEFVRGQIAMIVLGIPLALFLGGLMKLLWPTGRWLVTVVTFVVWAAIGLAGIARAMQKD